MAERPSVQPARNLPSRPKEQVSTPLEQAAGTPAPGEAPRETPREAPGEALVTFARVEAPPPPPPPAPTPSAGGPQEPLFQPVAVQNQEGQEGREPQTPPRPAEAEEAGLVTFAPVVPSPPDLPTFQPVPNPPRPQPATAPLFNRVVTPQGPLPQFQPVKPSGLSLPGPRAPLPPPPPPPFSGIFAPRYRRYPRTPPPPPSLPGPSPPVRVFTATLLCPNCQKEFAFNLRFQRTECPWCGFMVHRPPNGP